jgi:uncharacterized protein (DUF885 family)
MMKMPHPFVVTVTVGLLLLLSSSGRAETPSSELASLVEKALGIRTTHWSAEELSKAAGGYRSILQGLETIDRNRLEPGDQIDYDLLEAKAKTRLFEIEDAELHKLVPVRYFALRRTNSLFIRPGAQPDKVVREAVRELERLPTILANAKQNLTEPARVWTQNAIYQAYYAKMLLTDYVPEASVGDPALKKELEAAAKSVRVRRRRERQAVRRQQPLPQILGQVDVRVEQQ